MAPRPHPGGRLAAAAVVARRLLAACAVLAFTTAAARAQGTPPSRQKGVTPAPLGLLVYVTGTNGQPLGPVTPTNDRLYPGWCDLYSFGAGAFGPGDGSNQVSLMTLTLDKAPDATSVLFYKLLANNTAVNMTFVVVRYAPDRLESWKVRLTNARLVLQSFAIGGGGDLVESAQIAYQAVTWSYLDTDATGKALNEIYTTYDSTSKVTTTGTNPPSYPGGTDADGDGIPDGWEYFYGLTRTSPLDVDGDGQTNLQEFLAGTLPTDPRSALRTVSVTGSVNAGMATVTATWQSVANKTYVLESATNPAGPWTTVATVPSAGDGTTTYTNTHASGAPFFYRVRIGP